MDSASKITNATKEGRKAAQRNQRFRLKTWPQREGIREISERNKIKILLRLGSKYDILRSRNYV